MRGFNELKGEGLKVLLEKGALSSLEVAEELLISQDNAQMLLLRLYRQGLASRVAAKPGRRGRQPYLYTVTKRGSQRLEYYETKRQ